MMTATIRKPNSEVLRFNIEHQYMHEFWAKADVWKALHMEFMGFEHPDDSKTIEDSRRSQQPIMKGGAR